jgi:hypothetical protein
MHTLVVDTRVTVLAAGLTFLLALLLGIWKYGRWRPMRTTSPIPMSTPHIELSAWATWVNLTAAMVLVFFFLFAIVAYIVHGIRRDTTNQFEHIDAKHVRPWQL